MKKYVKVAVLILIGLIFVGTFVFLYQKSQPKETVYEVSPVGTDTLVQTTVATGKIEPRDEVQIKPQISGIIAEVYKEAGQTVKAGEVIAKVKVIPELGQLNSAEAACVWPPSTANRQKQTWNAWKNSTSANS